MWCMIKNAEPNLSRTVGKRTYEISKACSENIISQTGFVYPTFCPTW